MKSLSTLIKRQKTFVDEQRQLLSKLQDALAEVEKRIMMLEVEKAREQVVAQESADARATFGIYIKAAIQKGKDLEKHRLAAAAAVEAAREKLMELFEEQKRYETAEAARIEAEARKARQRETQDMDEVGSVQFARKKD